MNFGINSVGPSYLIPLENYSKNSDNSINKCENGTKRKAEACTDPNQCPYCTKQYTRYGNLKKHIQTHHRKLCGFGKHTENDGAESSIDEDSTEGSENTAHTASNNNEDSTRGSETSSDQEQSNGSNEEESDSENDIPLSDSEIRRIRNLIAMAELGDIKVTKITLTSLLTKPASDDFSDDDEDPYVFRHLALTVLREILVAAKQNQMILTKKLYFDIVDSLDLSGREGDWESETVF